MTTTDEKIAAYIQHLTKLFQQQVLHRTMTAAEAEQGWPASFVFPEPQDDDEREALRRFLAEVEKEMNA